MLRVVVRCDADTPSKSVERILPPTSPGAFATKHTEVLRQATAWVSPLNSPQELHVDGEVVFTLAARKTLPLLSPTTHVVVSETHETAPRLLPLPTACI